VLEELASKKNRSPATALKRYKSFSLAGLSVPVTALPGVMGAADAKF
jgi:hypothetical protein